MLPAIQFLAILVVAICLVPGGAHVFALPNKMAMAPDAYMTAQQIYAGWAQFGIAIVAALALTLIHTVMVRRDRAAFSWSLLAFLCLVAGQAVFWTLTYPMNVASANWTTMPPDLAGARRQWEYSHVADAALTFVAFVAIVLSALGQARRSCRESGQPL